MRKRLSVTIIMVLALLFSLAACSTNDSEKKTEQTTTSDEIVSTESSTEAPQEVGMANPWSEVETPQEAADGAGVASFTLPEGGKEIEGRRVDWIAYRYMEGLAEADGYIGTAELTARKGLKEKFDDVSGDYTEYSSNWEQTVGDITVACSGNEEGKTMRATWTSGDYSYSIMVRGQGDHADTYGIEEEYVAALVSAIQ